MNVSLFRAPQKRVGWTSCYTAVLATVLFYSLLFTTALVHAQAGLTAFPTAGQDDKRQKIDRFQCHEMAVGGSGINPHRTTVETGYDYKRKPAPGRDGYFGQARVGEGGLAFDATGGAAVGAMGGAIIGGVGAGAGVGLVAGPLLGVVNRFRWDKELADYYRKTAAQRKDEKELIVIRTEKYRRIWATCMRGRNYEVQ